jgi:hypothetical protein
VGQAGRVRRPGVHVRGREGGRDRVRREARPGLEGALTVLTTEQAKGAIHALRVGRRRQHRANFDWVDALYRAYLTGAGAIAATLFLSGVLGDADASASTRADLASKAPAWLGLAIALLVFGALRSGARGGPLVIEAADVQYLLLAPIDRGLSLRGVVLRQLRTRVFFAVVGGAVIGNLAFRRLPGHPGTWIAALMLFGAVGAVVTHSAGVIASGRRLSTATATAIGTVLVAWSAIDVAAGVQTSPLTWAGRLALLPLTSPTGAWAAAAAIVIISVGLLVAALLSVGGASLERALRRAQLTAVLRFAATVGDLRAVVLLRRQLASELPRQRPYVRIGGSGKPSRFPVWRRGWQSFVRWPVVRVVRVLVLGVVAGAAAVGAWDTTPLIAVGALALLFAAFDAVEPYAQEVDHPTRRDSLPVEPKQLARAHLAAPLALMVLLVAIAVVTALIIEPTSRTLVIGVASIVPATLAPIAAAAFSVTADPFAASSGVGSVLAASGGIASPGFDTARQVAPFVIALFGGAPLVAASFADRAHKQAGPAAINAAVVATILSVAVLLFAESQIAGRKSS